MHLTLCGGISCRFDGLETRDHNGVFDSRRSHLCSNVSRILKMDISL